MKNLLTKLNPFAHWKFEAARARDAYLTLMQDCLTNRIYEDPPYKRFGMTDYDPAARESGRDWPSTAHTMIGVKRMANLRTLVERVIEDRVPGDLIETGVWRGGACIFMRAILQAYEERDRRVWVADSFAGLPSPDIQRYPADAGQILHTFPELAVPLEEVKRNFDRYGLLDDQVVFLQGYFKDTLPSAPIERLAILRADGDFYESTSDALVNLYDKLSVGGFVIVDDYHAVPPCRSAVDDFRASRGIKDPVEEIDGVGIFWRKTGAAATHPDKHVTKSPSSPDWMDDSHLRIGDVRFFVTYDCNEMHAIESAPDNFLLAKSRLMVENMIEHGRQQKIRKVLDIGIFKGGSVALYDLIYQPWKLVAIDCSPTPVEALAKYIAQRGKSGVIKPCYGIDQADRRGMEAILAREFPEQDIDLIVDDASHLYESTRAAFNISFPYLKPGGLYIIEDWAWAHWSGDFWQKDNPYFKDKIAMSNLLIELFMLSASRPDLIEEIVVTNAILTLKKGRSRLPPGDFDIGEHYLLRGKHFEAVL